MSDFFYFKNLICSNLHFIWSPVLTICNKALMWRDSPLATLHSRSYSDRKLFTGLLIAAFTAWKLMVTSATNAAITPASKNSHQGMAVR